MYKKFFIKLLLLGAIVVMVTAAYFSFYIQRINHISINKKYHVLACGDSHVQCAIDDSQMPGVLNISKSSQCYLYTYHVLKKIINNNPHIDTIILGYSFHSLSDIFDENLKRRTIKNDYPDYLPLLDEESMTFMMRQNTVGIIRLMPNIINNSFINGTLNREGYPFIGHFYRSKRSNLNDSLMKAKVNKQFRKKEVIRGISKMQEFYLKKIINYCSQKNVKVILLNTPVYPEYRKRIPDAFVSAYYDFFKTSCNPARMIDLHNMPLPKAYYGDGHHVNKYGAKVFTQTLDSLLRGK